MSLAGKSPALPSAPSRRRIAHFGLSPRKLKKNNRHSDNANINKATRKTYYEATTAIYYDIIYKHAINNFQVIISGVDTKLQAA